MRNDRPPTPRSTLIVLIATCIIVFVTGLILLVVGFVKFSQQSQSVPYMWSITLCRVNGTEKWVGMELTSRQDCPDILPENGERQFITIPSGILSPTVPYDPVIYVTNKVTGTVTFSQKINDDDVVFSTSARLSSLEVTKFAYCGGMELVVFRDGPLIGEGDYITTDCQNFVTGCQYEPGRSINRYKFEGVQVKITDIPEEGSQLVIESIILEASSTSIILPDAYIHYEVGGRGEQQDQGLILLVLGGIMADLMPAALYFLVSKPAVPGGRST